MQDISAPVSTRACTDSLPMFIDRAESYSFCFEFSEDIRFAVMSSVLHSCLSLHVSWHARAGAFPYAEYWLLDGCGAGVLWVCCG